MVLTHRTVTVPSGSSPTHDLFYNGDKWVAEVQTFNSSSAFDTNRRILLAFPSKDPGDRYDSIELKQSHGVWDAEVTNDTVRFLDCGTPIAPPSHVTDPDLLPLLNEIAEGPNDDVSIIKLGARYLGKDEKFANSLRQVGGRIEFAGGTIYHPSCTTLYPGAEEGQEPMSKSRFTYTRLGSVEAPSNVA
jgi:hypothetical protein